MNKFLCVLAVFCLSLPALSQSFIVKNDGQKVSYKKWKMKKGWLALKTESGKLDIPFDQIAGYYESQGPFFNYLKPYVNLDPERNMQFVHRVIEGKINIYRKVEQRVTTVNGMTSTYTVIRYYSEKGDLWDEVYSKSILKSERKVVEMFEPFLSDKPSHLQSLEQLEKKNLMQIFDVIRAYNQECFQEEPLPENLTIKVVFKRPVKNQIAEKLQVTVGKKMYEMGPGDSREFWIPVNTQVRACARTASGEEKCDIVFSHPDLEKQYRITYREKQGLMIGSDVDYVLGLFNDD